MTSASGWGPGLLSDEIPARAEPKNGYRAGRGRILVERGYYLEPWNIEEDPVVGYQR